MFYKKECQNGNIKTGLQNKILNKVVANNMK